MTLKKIKVNKPINLKDESSLNNILEEDKKAKEFISVASDFEENFPNEEVVVANSTSEKNIKEVKPQRLLQEYKFPDDFLWGTSTSAYQIEGGITNDWSEWERSKERRVELEKNGEEYRDFVAGKACDSFNRYEEDFDKAVELGTNSIRLGIEWARIEPTKDTWDIEAVKHYRKMLQSAKERGFIVVLTIWHWTNPTWVVEQGGWTNKETVKDYLRFAELAAEEFGLYVDYWVTLNEPMVHVVNGYLTGKFPPNKKSPIKALKVFNNLFKAHNEAYEIIHKHCPNARVSITGLINYTEPAHKWNPLEAGIAKTIHYFWNHRFLKRIEKALDYIGFDYYFHDRIVWHPPFKKNEDESVNDMGWEIYPEGIYHVLKYLNSFGKPLLVMENGIPDVEDNKRADFIRDHLYWVHKAIEEGVDVQGYFYWSLLDNFEWAAGWAPKFGLVEVNRKTFERKIKTSAKVYKEICESNILRR